MESESRQSIMTEWPCFKACMWSYSYAELKLHIAMTYGMWGIAPRILNLYTRRSWDHGYVQAALPLVKIKERHCTYYVTLRRVRVSVVAVGKYYIFWVCVCSLGCPPRMRHIVVWSVWFCHIFFTLFHKRHDFREKVTEHKICVLIFSTTFVRKISHSKRNSGLYIMNVLGHDVKFPSFLLDFCWNLNFLVRFSKKFSNIKLHDNPNSESRVAPFRRTDRRDDANCCSSLFPQHV